MILHGIEYQRPTSLNMRILADHVTYSFLAFMKSIFHFCLGCYCGGYSQNGRSNLSSLALLITHFISFEVQRRLSKFYFVHNKSRSWHLPNDHSRMVEIIGTQNYAFHDSMPGHQLNILWQNAVSDLYIFDHQRVNISLGLILERFIPQSKVNHSEIWSFVKCRFLPSSCISQFANMEIICKQCKLRIKDISHSFGQNLRLKHMLIVDSICH